MIVLAAFAALLITSGSVTAVYYDRSHGLDGGFGTLVRSNMTTSALGYSGGYMKNSRR